MARVKLATVWLGGCSGCHMSLLDVDEWLLELATMAEIVYSPFVDTKQYPQNIDIILIEGAVANEEHISLLKTIRKQTKIVVALGDCAITGNVTAMRNIIEDHSWVLRCAYVQNADTNPSIPECGKLIPKLLNKVLPVHNVIKVDYFLPGCPPNAEKIRIFLEQLLTGQKVELPSHMLKFG